jgi:hypothetical protein
MHLHVWVVVIGDVRRRLFRSSNKSTPTTNPCASRRKQEMRFSWRRTTTTRGLSSYWSRRIDDEHRLVYRADDDVKILKARYRY